MKIQNGKSEWNGIVQIKAGVYWPTPLWHKPTLDPELKLSWRLSWREFVIQRIESWPKVQNNCRSWTPGTLDFRMFGSAMLPGIGSTLLGIGMGKASLHSGPVSSDHICIQRPPMLPPAKDNPQLNSSCKRLKILSWIPWRIMITSLFTTAPICCKNW